MSDATHTKSSQRKYSARAFTRAPMVCPHCHSRIEQPTAVCEHCDFELSYCTKAFPFAAPPLSLVIDPAKLLPEGIEKEVRRTYNKVRKRARQVEISFCFVRLQAGVSIEEFAFWLHNTAPGADESRAWQLLVVGDLTSGQLTLTSGYALEPFIKPEIWEAALQELAACIADDQWKEGLNGFLIDARVLLTAAWQSAERRRQKNHRRREQATESNLPKEDRSPPPEKAKQAVEKPDHDGRDNKSKRSGKKKKRKEDAEVQASEPIKAEEPVPKEREKLEKQSAPS